MSGFCLETGNSLSCVFFRPRSDTVRITLHTSPSVPASRPLAGFQSSLRLILSFAVLVSSFSLFSLASALPFFVSLLCLLSVSLLWILLARYACLRHLSDLDLGDFSVPPVS